MIVTDYFVYVHLHKTGGTFLNEGLLRFFPSARHVGYHLPCRLVPKPYHGLPLLGFVRNPWSYYVSWFAFQSARAQPNVLFDEMSEGGRLDFAATVRNLLDLGSGSPKLDALLARLPAAYGNRGLNLPRFALEPIRGSGVGFFTFLYRYMYDGRSGPIHLARVEELRTEFLKFLADIAAPVPPGLEEFVTREAARNASRHAPYATYYDEALRELVAQRDRDVIGTFGYRFGD